MIQPGDVVLMDDKQFLVVTVERNDDPGLGCGKDMGRYTLIDEEGRSYSNMPGYLMEVIGNVRDGKDGT